MGRKPRPASHIKGAPVFAEYLAKLDKMSYLYKSIDGALTVLKKDCLVGVKIQQNLWPKRYLRNYGITNLFKFNLEKGFRLLYTVAAEDKGLSVIVLECLNHKEYEKRFGYDVT